MRKLTEKQKLWLARRARAGSAPLRKKVAGEVNHEALERAVRKDEARKAHQAIVDALPPLPEKTISESRLVLIDPPRKLNLADNYEECLAFIMRLRSLQERSRSHVARNERLRWKNHYNISRIEDLDPAAGLLLAAELDSFHQVRALRSQDRSWHENVRSYFIESGLFELLNISPQRALAKPPTGPLRHVLKFRKGTLPDGVQADSIRRELEQLCGDSFGPRIAINNSLCEAMTNSHHHAYPEDQVWWPIPPKGNWWAGGAWTPATKTVHMVIYDQGVGIPATLPRSPHWASAIPLLNRIDPEGTDAGLIEAALELRRTSTNIPGRGRGLYEMTEWIDNTKTGFLRIWSGRGRVTYRPESVQRTTLKAPFCGTLIEWEVQHG